MNVVWEWLLGVLLAAQDADIEGPGWLIGSLVGTPRYHHQILTAVSQPAAALQHKEDQCMDLRHVRLAPIGNPRCQSPEH